MNSLTFFHSPVTPAAFDNAFKAFTTAPPRSRRASKQAAGSAFARRMEERELGAAYQPQFRFPRYAAPFGNCRNRS